MSRRKLPPLSALRAFEAAARHGSFTRAAEELNLTQSAVSRQIKDLEAQRRHWDSAAVARALRHVVQADAAVKGAAVDAHYALEAMVLEVEQARVGR